MDKLKNNSKPFLVFNIINFILVLFCILFIAIINNNESTSMSKDSL